MRLLLLWLTSVAAMEPPGGVSIETEIAGGHEEHFTREDVSCSFMLMGMFVFTMAASCWKRYRKAASGDLLFGELSR